MSNPRQDGLNRLCQSLSQAIGPCGNVQIPYSGNISSRRQPLSYCKTSMSLGVQDVRHVGSL